MSCRSALMSRGNSNSSNRSIPAAQAIARRKLFLIAPTTINQSTPEIDNLKMASSQRVQYYQCNQLFGSRAADKNMRGNIGGIEKKKTMNVVNHGIQNPIINRFNMSNCKGLFLNRFFSKRVFFISLF